MKNFVELTHVECSFIGGGRSAWIGELVAGISSAVGAFAKLCYLAHRQGLQSMTQRAMAGDLTMWN